MNDITAVIITKNEEEIIGDCLKSLDFLKEIIVLDANSADKTVKIASQYNARVITQSFKDFSQMRNSALKRVNSDWILYVDADERVSPLLEKEILTAVLDQSYSAYRFVRKNYYLGRQWPYKEYVTRLFLKKNFKFWQGQLHETPIFDGQVKKIDGELFHYTHRNIQDMLRKTIVWSEIEARLRFENKHPLVTWWRLSRVFFTGFFDSYIKQRGFRAGNIGIMESLYQGFSLFITYARLWELQKNQI